MSSTSHLIIILEGFLYMVNDFAYLFLIAGVQCQYLRSILPKLSSFLLCGLVGFLMHFCLYASFNTLSVFVLMDPLDIIFFNMICCKSAFCLFSLTYTCITFINDCS